LISRLRAQLQGSVTAEVDVIQMAIALATQIDEPLLVPVGPGVVMTVSLIYGCELGLDGQVSPGISISCSPSTARTSRRGVSPEKRPFRAFSSRRRMRTAGGRR
jgi:hypothetical protein